MSAKDQIKQIVDYFKREPYLKDKTDAMGDGLMLGANLADEANERSKAAEDTTKRTEEKYKEQILAQDLNPNKDPELVDLRGGNATAGERITKFEQETTAQFQQTDIKLSQKANQLFVDTMQVYFENKIKSVIDGSPKGVEPTFEALKLKYPTKTEGVYVVTADNNWYFWLDGFGWTSGGVYQTYQIADGAIDRKKLAPKYAGNGLIASGSVNIDTYLTHGATILSAPIQGTLPADFNRAEAGFIINIGSDPMCFQILMTYNKTYTQLWSRIVYTSGTLGEWESGLGTRAIANSSIKREKLIDNFRDNGTFSGDIDTLKKEGSFLVLPPYTGTLPQGYSNQTASIVDVSATGGSWVTQTLRPLYGAVEPNVRSLRGTNPISEITAWQQVVTTSKKKRKLLFLGDSIPDASKYPDKIKNNTGIAVTNVAIGGTTFSKHALNDYDAFSGVNIMRSLISGNWSLQDAANVTVKTSKLVLLKGIDLSTYTDIVFAYGTNDAYSITLPGEDDDTTEDTYSGAINLTMEMLFEHAPLLQVSLISPIFRARNASGDGRNSDDFPAPNGSYLREFVEVLENKKLKYHVPILDLYNNSGINKFTHATFLSDGVHLTDTGADRLANVVGSFLISSY